MKNLKELIKEADEPTEGEEGAEKQKPEVPKKPAKTVQQVKDASDGVGHETFDLSSKIGETLQSNLPMFMNLKGVSTDNGSITISGVTSKKTGNPVELEKAKTFITQLIQPTMDKFGNDDYNLVFSNGLDGDSKTIFITVMKNTNINKV